MCGGAWLEDSGRWTYQPCSGEVTLRADGGLVAIGLDGERMERPAGLPRGAVGDLVPIGDGYLYRAIQNRRFPTDGLSMPRYRVDSHDVPLPFEETLGREVRRNWTATQITHSPTFGRVAIHFYVSGAARNQLRLFDFEGSEISALAHRVEEDISLIGFASEGTKFFYRDGESNALRSWNWTTDAVEAVEHPVLLDGPLPTWLFPRGMVPDGYVVRAGEQDWFVGTRCEDCPVEVVRTTVHVR